MRQAKNVFDWSKDATGESSLSGMTGNRAALIVAGEMAKELSDETDTNAIRDLQEQLLARSSE